jgi:hypothetical protein
MRTRPFLPTTEAAVAFLEGITSSFHSIHAASSDTPPHHIHSSNMISCGEVSAGMLRSDTAEKLIRDASRQFNDCGKKFFQPLDRFKAARTAMLDCTTIADLGAHYLEASTHLKTVNDNLNEYIRLNNSLDVEALFAMACQSEEYRGLTDEQLKAGVEKRVAKVRWMIRKHVEYCDVVLRKQELNWSMACRIDYHRNRATRGKASGNEYCTRPEAQWAHSTSSCNAYDAGSSPNETLERSTGVNSRSSLFSWIRSTRELVRDDGI